MPTYFHGSCSDNIKAFRPFSHFGTMDQAMSAIAKKQEAWAAGDHKLTGDVEPVPTLYEVEIDLAALSKPLAISDVGTPKSIGIAMGARDAFAPGSPLACPVKHDAFEAIRASLYQEKAGWRLGNMSEEQKTIADLKLHDRGWRLIAKELRNQGWTCLEYTNVVEGGSPQSSICIPDPTHILRFRQRPVSAEELAGALHQSRPVKPV